MAVDRLPNFLADPNVSETEPMPHHRCTIHINSETTACLERAYRDAAAGRPSDRSAERRSGVTGHRRASGASRREMQSLSYSRFFVCFCWIEALQLPIRTIITGLWDAG